MATENHSKTFFSFSFYFELSKRSILFAVYKYLVKDTLKALAQKMIPIDNVTGRAVIIIDFVWIKICLKILYASECSSDSSLVHLLKDIFSCSIWFVVGGGENRDKGVKAKENNGTKILIFSFFLSFFYICHNLNWNEENSRKDVRHIRDRYKLLR